MTKNRATLSDRSVDQFLNELASNSPAPGGGSVAAFSAALGAALTSMVCNLTFGKKKYADIEGEMKIVFKKSEELRHTFTKLVDEKILLLVPALIPFIFH